MEKSTFATKVGLSAMLKGGVIMDVVNAEQAKIAEEAGAAAPRGSLASVPESKCWPPSAASRFSSVRRT